ncbi:adenylyltransferase/cytidyltransferase family protein [Candidatus Gottesmanbacteria bacterium]|nr:adenylyltransferase/cytidyltransferase family protein [Candidatus Gottesmanbacteria bacterium]
MEKRVVLVGGCFDLLHYKQAKQKGDKLIVLLESDEKVKKLKGDSRPIHSQSQRKQMLEALSFIDEVIMLPRVTTDQDYVNLVERIKPDVIAVTVGDPMVDKKRQQAARFGATLVEIPKIHTPSTSQLAKLLGLE